jgi:hypothetical protein
MRRAFMGKLFLLREDHRSIYDAIHRFRPIAASSLSRPIGSENSLRELCPDWDLDEAGLHGISLFDFSFERSGDSVGISAYTLPTGDRFYLANDPYEGLRIIAAAHDTSHDTELVERLFDFESDVFCVPVHLGISVPDLVGISDAWPFSFWKQRFVAAFQRGVNWEDLEQTLAFQYALEELRQEVDLLFPPSDADPDWLDPGKVSARLVIERCLAVPEREALLLERLAHVWLAGASFKKHEIRKLVRRVRKNPDAA